MRIERYGEPPESWDAYVEAHPDAHLSHASAWAKVFHNVYGLDPVYLTAVTSVGAVCGVLPLVRARSWLGRRQLISMPYLDGGGVLADDSEIERSLLAEALGLAHEARSAEVELRQLAPLKTVAHAALEGRVRMLLSLAETEEAQWGALRAKVRNQTRKAERTGLALLPNPGAQEFFAPFAVNMRDLGTPPHPARFFQAAADAFGDRFRFFVTGDAGRPVGSLVAIDFAGVVSVPWAATLREERARCPNNQIYWEALRWAISRGARHFDFGRSHRDAGTHRFKKGWGALEEPLHWLRLAEDGTHTTPSAEADRSILRWASRAWQHLPLGVANWLGPRIRPHLLS